MKEVENIVRILKESRDALNSGNSYGVKKLSDQTIHAAAIYQDPDNIIVAVLIYSLSKVMERDYYKQLEGWDQFYNSFIKNIDIAIKSLEKGDVKKARDALGSIRDSLNKMEGDLSRYVRDVFLKAEINKAFKMYEHGLSAEQTASLLGVSLWDLSTYIGQSSISEAHVSESLPVKERIKFAEEIFS